MSPADIAKKLTPAQKRALLWLPADGKSKNRYASIDAALAPREDVLAVLQRRGLARAPGGMLHILCASELGLSVRAILAQEPTP